MAIITCRDADYSTAPVPHGLFQYAYPVLSVHAIYTDRGRNPGQLVEVGYVARTRGNRHCEWVVRNSAGQLWPSYGCTMRDAVIGAARDGVI